MGGHGEEVNGALTEQGNGPTRGSAPLPAHPVLHSGEPCAIFDWHNQSRWQEILDELDEALRARHDPARLSRGWAAMAGMFGRLERTGEPFARRAGDDTVVDVPLHFEAGDAKGIVRFSGDGKIAGMAIRPASPAPEKELT